MRDDHYNNENSNEQSKEYVNFQTVIKEYKAAKKEASKEKKGEVSTTVIEALQQARNAYVQSLPPEHFLDNRNIENYLKLTKDIFGSGPRACLELEKLCDTAGLSLDKDTLELKKDLYSLEHLRYLKRNFSSIMSGIEEPYKSEKLEEVNNRFLDLSRKILKNEKFPSNITDSMKFGTIVSLNRREMQRDELLENRLTFCEMFASLYQKESLKSNESQNKERLQYFSREFINHYRHLAFSITLIADKSPEKYERYLNANSMYSESRKQLEQRSTSDESDLKLPGDSPKEARGVSSSRTLSRERSSSSLSNNTNRTATPSPKRKGRQI